jgi:hypothetical protein
MDDLFLVLGLMTHDAKVRNRLHEGNDKVPRMLSLLQRVISGLMTGRAHAFLYGIMDDLVLAHGDVTLGADTAFRGWSRCGLGRTMAGKKKKYQQEFEQPDQIYRSDRMLFPHICLTP